MPLLLNTIRELICLWIASVLSVLGDAVCFCFFFKLSITGFLCTRFFSVLLALQHNFSPVDCKLKINFYFFAPVNFKQRAQDMTRKAQRIMDKSSSVMNRIDHILNNLPEDQKWHNLTVANIQDINHSLMNSFKQCKFVYYYRRDDFPLFLLLWNLFCLNNNIWKKITLLNVLNEKLKIEKLRTILDWVSLFFDTTNNCSLLQNAFENYD